MNAGLARILVVDDDRDYRMLLFAGLKREFDVSFAERSAEVLDFVRNGNASAILLDVGLPGEDGFSLARSIRRLSNVPILFVSGRDAEDSVIQGLNVGGDDYVTKPVSLAVLAARIRSILRRHPDGGEQWNPLLEMGQFTLCPQECRLVANGSVALDLTAMETKVLSVLMAHHGATVSRDEFSRRLHGRDWDGMSREIDVHVAHLRRKLWSSFGLRNAIRSVRGAGYRLSLPTGQRVGGDV